MKQLIQSTTNDMEELSELETVLLDGLTTKYPSLKSHIPYIKVAKREKVGVGMIVHFEYVNFKEPLEEINALFSTEENIELKNLRNGLSYLIDVTDGEIKYIDFFTSGEEWNGKFVDFKIIKEEDE